jgi:hypothetical protein
MKASVRQAVAGLSHRVGYAAFLSLASGVAVIVPSRSSLVDSVFRAVAYLDVPISAVGLLLPWGWRGVWAFFYPVGACSGITRDVSVLLVKQVLIGTPVYVTILYLPRLVSVMFKRSRRAQPIFESGA